MCLFCCLSDENFTGKLSHISSFHFNFVLGTKQSVFCMLYVRVSYDYVKVLPVSAKQQFERPSKFVSLGAGNTLPREILLILCTILLLFCFTVFLRVFADSILPFTVFDQCPL